MPPENWFRRKSSQSSGSAPQSAQATRIPDGLAVKCAGCGEILFNKDFERCLKVCPKCGFHARIGAELRIQITADEGSFEELAESLDLRSRDFLRFADYTEKLTAARDKAGAGEGYRVGLATIESRPVMLGVCDFFFLGGSMGSVACEKIALAIERAIELRLPVVFFTASGGARMHEGLTSLMQMAKTAAVCARLGAAGLPLIVVLTDPTIGGVTASYASLGDVILAEPGALIALAGERVAAQAAQGQKLPANYQSSEWRLEHGQVDQIVPRRDLRPVLGRLIGLLTPETAKPAKKAAAHRNGSVIGLPAAAGVAMPDEPTTADPAPEN